MVFQCVKKSLAEFAARRLQSFCRKNPEGFSTVSNTIVPSMVFFLQAECRQGRGQSSSAAVSSAVSGSVQSTMVATQRVMFFPSP